MHREFWLERWRRNEIGWHQAEVNPWLAARWAELGIPAERAVFVPLCGKSLDMRWLHQQGHPVIGVELSEAAVTAYFEEAEEVYRAEQGQFFRKYVGTSATIYCGDFMDLTVLQLKGVGAVFDRGALVALPPAMRVFYADHLLRIVPERTRILLVTLEYDQRRLAGPPHAVSEAEVEALFSGRCSIEVLAREPTSAVPARFVEAGLDRVVETVYVVSKLR